MAEEHIGTAFGAIGALDILTRSIKDGFSVWKQVQNSNQSIKDFQILLDLEESRFLHWTREWGIESNPHIANHNIRMHQARIIIPYLQQIQKITCQLRSDFDMILPTLRENQSLGILETIASQLPNPYINLHATDKVGMTSTTSREKVNWMLQQKKFNDGMALLRSLLDELFMCFPIPNKDPVGPILYVSSLRSQDSATLAHVGHIVDDPLGKGLAFSKSMAYMPASAKRNVSILDKEKLLVETSFEDNPNRFVGTYDGTLVLIERKSVKTPKLPIHESDPIKARIENIVMRLQDERKPHQLRTLSCCGVTSIYKSTSTATEWLMADYNIVYKIDMPTFFSLRQLLSQSNSNNSDSKEQKKRGVRTGIPLGRRFIIAQTLASAVMFLHLADWLHKAIRSDNVLFFAESMTAAGNTLPYLVGFEYSRPDALDERTEDIVDERDYKFYRHPDAHFVPVADLRQPLGGAGRYSKVYDIYSLGVILLELGLFKSARTIVRTYTGSKADINGEAIRRVLLNEGIAELKFYMGEVYANAAYLCLVGFFDTYDKDELPRAFSKHVVRPLSDCQA